MRTLGARRVVDEVFLPLPPLQPSSLFAGVVPPNGFAIGPLARPSTPASPILRQNWTPSPSHSPYPAMTQQVTLSLVENINFILTSALAQANVRILKIVDGKYCFFFSKKSRKRNSVPCVVCVLRTCLCWRCYSSKLFESFVLVTSLGDWIAAESTIGRVAKPFDFSSRTVQIAPACVILTVCHRIVGVCAHCVHGFRPAEWIGRGAAIPEPFHARYLAGFWGSETG